MDKAEIRRKETQKKYSKTEKFKGAQKRYEKTDKGKKVRKKYTKSEKGMQAQLRYYFSGKGIKAREDAKQRRRLLSLCSKYLISNPGKTPSAFLETLSKENQSIFIGG